MSLSDDIKQLTGLCIVGSRQSGKTTQLIKLSAATRVPIMTAHADDSCFIKRIAQLKGYDIPEPLVFNATHTLQGVHSEDGLKPVLIDEVQMFFNRYGLRPVVMTMPFYAAEFALDERVMKQAKPSLFQLLRMRWRCRKEIMK